MEKEYKEKAELWAKNEADYHSRLKILENREKSLDNHANDLGLQSSSLESASENIRQQKDEWEKALVARAAALDNLRNDLLTREQTVSEREIFAEKNEDDQTKLLEEEWQACRGRAKVCAI